MNKKVIGIAIVLVVGLMLFGCTGSNTTTGANTTPAANAQAAKVYQIGEKIVLGDLTYSMNSVDQLETLGSEYINKIASDGATYYLVEFTIQNTGNSEKSVTISNDITVNDDKGRIYKPDFALSLYAKQSGFEPLGIIEKIPAGLSKTGIVVFEMPIGTTGQLKINPSMFVGEATIKFN